MKRGFSAGLALLLALSPLNSAWALGRKAGVPVLQRGAAPLALSSLSSLPIAPLAAGLPALPPAAISRLQPDIDPRLPELPEAPAPLEPGQDGDAAAAEASVEEGKAAFDGAGTPKSTVSDGASAEAVKELLRLRRAVQSDARDVLIAQMAGDVGSGELHRDVSRILGRLVRAAGLPKEAAQAFVGNSFLPNAFTTVTPSEAEFIKNKSSIAKPFRVSNVFVSLGLLRALDTEEQLAFVLAHELSHNWKEHLKGFAGSHQMLGHFHEFEADFEALKLMAKGGYDPRKGLDTLYALDRAYEQIEKNYAFFSRKDKGEIAKSLQRMRDVHPHADLRRANMLDHLDEALELYAAEPAPAPTPKWMELRHSATRPSALDRFERRARAAAAEGTVSERLHKLESFVEREKAKRQLSVDEKAVAEEADRDILRTDPDFEDTRSVELSTQRGDLAAPLRSDLVAKQLDLLLVSRNTTLEDFLRASAGLGASARQSGALRLMGQADDRRKLDAMYRALTRGAETLMLSADNGIGPKIASRLWRSTRRVLSQELGRPAKPEEVIDELKRGLSPSWLRTFRNELNIHIVESAFERPGLRSERFTPSQLAARLEGLDKPDKRASYIGLSPWNDKHYTAGALGASRRGQIVHNYERYRVDGLTAPSSRDFADLLHAWGGYDLPPALVRILRRENLLEAYIDVAVGTLEDQLYKEEVLLENPRLNFYNESVAHILHGALHGVSDLEEVGRVSAMVWARVRKTHEELKARGRESGLSSETLAVSLLSAITISARNVLVRLNQAGARPTPGSLDVLAAAVRDIEETLGLPPGREVVMSHARTVLAGMGSDETYAAAFHGAIPNAMEGADARGWRPKFLRPKPVVGPRALRVSDLLALVLLVVDEAASAGERVAAAALADKFYHVRQNSGEYMEDRVSIFAGQTVGRWLLEAAVARARADATLPALVKTLLRVNDMHPSLLNPVLEGSGSPKTAFRSGALYVRRNEPMRTLARQEHPFRGVNARWGLELLAGLDEADSWPKSQADRLDLLDFMNSSGEFSDALDARVIAEASADRDGFRDWILRDERRIKLLGGGDSLLATDLGLMTIPRAAPLRIVRNPNLRAKLFDLTREAQLKEKAPRRTLRQTFRAYSELYRAYREARQFLSAAFLAGLRNEGSLESKFYLLIEEIDRISREKAEDWRARWDRGRFEDEERASEVDGRPLPTVWRESLPSEKEEILKARRLEYQQKALAAVYKLYLAFAATQEPVLGMLLENYPEPTRSRDELLERVMKARRLTPGSLSFLESNKSYRQPNPLRMAEKQFLDQAITHLRRFAPADRVDLILYMAGIVTLPRERVRELDRMFLKGDRRKLARDKAALRGVSQLKGYLSLLHPKDRSMLVRGLFFGPDTLHQNPAEVQRFYEAIVLKDRNLPKFVEETFRAYFRGLTDDEKAVLISNLAGTADMGQSFTGPEVVRIALKGMGVTGAKVAQVLATHRGLLPEEYAVALEGFKDRAQDMGKMRFFELVKERLEALSDDPAKPRAVALKDISALADEALPRDNPSLRTRMARQVRYILAEEGKQVRRVKYMGPELGSGSIKVVYKAELKDGRVWVIKLRAPGAKHRTTREFAIVEAMVADLERSGTLDLPGVRQLIDEVRSLVRAEMDFRDEAAKETGVRDRAQARPWYARLLVGPAPYVPKPHPLFVGEDLLVEEFVPTKRFSDLPEWSLLGPSKRSIARRAVGEGTYSMVHDEWLEPDAHTGNRYARRGFLDLFLTRLVIIDLGQGQAAPVARLKPLMRASLALESADLDAAADRLMDTLDASGAAQAGEIRAAVAAGLARRPDAGIVERLMDGYLEAEKSGALVKPEYAALQKGFLIYGGYAQYLPKNGLYAALERAALARMLRDGAVGRLQLLKLGLKRLLHGRAAVRAEMEALIDGL